MAYENYFKHFHDNMTLEEKIKVLKENENSARKVKEEIKRLNVIADGEIKTVNREEEKAYEEPKEKKLALSDCYYQKISMWSIAELSEEEVLDQLNDILPVEELSNKILYELKLRLYQDICTYGDMIVTCTNKEELQDCKAMIEELRLKINLIDGMEKVRELEETILPNNTLYFLTTGTGNVRVLESLRKNVPREYYPEFRELLLSIKNGTLKGFKKIKYNSHYFEVKGFKIRITFSNLTPGNYIIMDAFMKKEDTSRYYKNSIKKRYQDLEMRKKEVLTHLNEADYIKSQEDILAEILTLLDNKELEVEKEYGRTNS